MTTQAYPTEMDKKMKLLSYFKRYMTEHLVKAGGSVVVEQSDSVSRIPHMHTWFRTTCAVVMHLTNGSVQVRLCKKKILFSSKFFKFKLSSWIFFLLCFQHQQFQLLIL